MEGHKENAGEMEVVYQRRRVIKEQLPYFFFTIFSLCSGVHEDSNDGFAKSKNHDQNNCGFFCERISNEGPNLQSNRNRKNKRRKSCCVGMEGHKENAGEMEVVYQRRRVNKEQLPYFFITIFSLNSGVHEDSNYGFEKSKNHDQDNCWFFCGRISNEGPNLQSNRNRKSKRRKSCCVGMEGHKEIAGEMKVVYQRRRVNKEQLPYFFITIFSLNSGVHEDSNDGFAKSKNHDQDNCGVFFERISNEGPNLQSNRNRKNKRRISGCVGMEGHKDNAGEMEVVYQRRVNKEQLPYFFILIFSLNSGVHEDSNDGFAKSKNHDQDNCGFFSERISNEGPNLQSKHNRKNKRRISGQKVFNPKSHSCGQSGRVRSIKSQLRERIDDGLFDRCFRKLWRNSPEEKRNRFTYLNCLWFYMYTKEHFRERVLTWIKKRNIFSKTYAFVPIVLWSHWYLLILCHFGESLQSQNTTPCILLLDSLHELNPMRLRPLILRFVLDIYETEDIPVNTELIKKIPLLIPKVPQQRNGEECGIFVLYYVNLFLESAPDSFSISEGYPYFMKEDWFSEEELEGFYEMLESFDINSSDSE